VDDVPGSEDLLLASVTTREELTALLRTIRIRQPLAARTGEQNSLRFESTVEDVTCRDAQGRKVSP